MANQERTFIMIKPDGVHRGIVGEIVKRFEQKGYKLVAMKFMQVSISQRLPTLLSFYSKCRHPWSILRSTSLSLLGW